MSSRTALPRMICWRSPPQWSANPEHPLAQAVVRHADEARVPKLAATAFRNVPGHGARAPGGRPTGVGGQPPADDDRRHRPRRPGRRRDELAAAGRTAVLVAVDGRAVGCLALADAPATPPRQYANCTP